MLLIKIFEDREWHEFLMVLTNVVFISSLQSAENNFDSQTDPVLLSVSQPGSEKCCIIERPRENRERGESYVKLIL